MGPARLDERRVHLAGPVPAASSRTGMPEPPVQAPIRLDEGPQRLFAREASCLDPSFRAAAGPVVALQCQLDNRLLPATHRILVTATRWQLAQPFESPLPTRAPASSSIVLARCERIGGVAAGRAQAIQEVGQQGEFGR